MQLSVIIVNHNVKFFLEQCLLSAIRAMKDIDGEIIVVDNLSTDGSDVFFQNKFNTARFIWNKHNVGFAKANNQAILLARGEYILFLNPDTLVPEDCFEKCISFIKAKDNNCALGIKMIDGSGNFLKESKRAFPSPLTALYKITGLTRLFPHSKIFSRYHLGHLDKNSNHEVDVLAGAFMMVPKKILDITGGFDEDFFMYGEDIDLSFRIQEAGFRNFYFAESTVIHFKGESTSKGSLNYVKMFYKAMSIFVKKHYGNSRAGVFNFFIQLAIFFRAALAATARVVKKIGLPVMDAITILSGFFIVSISWETLFVKPVGFAFMELWIAPVILILLFLTASFFTGLYHSRYKQSRLIISALAATLLMSVLFGILNERFSFGFLFSSAALSLLLMMMIRQFLLRWKMIETEKEKSTISKAIVFGTEEEYNFISHFIEKGNEQRKIVSRIDPENQVGDASSQAIDLRKILDKQTINEIFFCEGTLSFKKIITMLPALPDKIKIKFFAKDASAVIGSDGKDAEGDFISGEENYHLADSVYRRAKKFLDVSAAVFFLALFPVFLIFKRRPLQFFKNALDVLSGKKTWVGYAINQKDLPALKPAVITTTGLPFGLNPLPGNDLSVTDRQYALHYHILNDLKLIWKNYHFLS